MLGSDLQAICRTRFRDPNQRIVTDATWLNYLQAGYKRVIGASKWWPWRDERTDVTISSGNSVALPADVENVTSVWDKTDEYPLSPIHGPGATYRELYPMELADGTGPPEMYRIYKGKIEVFPQPSTSTVLTLEYPISSTALTAGTEPAFPEEYHEATLVEYALGMAYLDDGDVEKFEAHMASFTASVQEMRVATFEVNRVEGFPEIVDDWFTI